MKDPLMLFHEFATTVTKALNDAKVTHVGSVDDLCGVMVLVGRYPGPPIAGSINYNQEKLIWELDEPTLAEKVKRE